MSHLNFQSFKRAMILSDKNKKSKSCKSFAIGNQDSPPNQVGPDWLNKFAICYKKCN